MQRPLSTVKGFIANIKYASLQVQNENGANLFWTVRPHILFRKPDVWFIIDIGLMSSITNNLYFLLGNRHSTLTGLTQSH